MKTFFEEPKLDVLLFTVEDVITLSSELEDNETSDTPNRTPMA